MTDNIKIGRLEIDSGFSYCAAWFFGYITSRAGAIDSKIYDSENIIVKKSSKKKPYT